MARISRHPGAKWSRRTIWFSKKFVLDLGVIRSRQFLAFTFGLVLCISPTLASARDDGAGYLIIRRAPNFGNAQWLQLRIDGAVVDPVAYGHDLRMPISAGHHVLLFRPSNMRWRTRPNRMSLNVAPGRTYEFTAYRSEDRVYLEPVR